MRTPWYQQFAKVDRGWKTPCWQWLGRRQVSVKGKDILPHRLFWQELGPGGLEPEDSLESVCGHGDCVNPEHRRVGMKLSENRKRCDTALVGRIHTAYRAGTRGAELAALFGIHPTTLSKVLSGPQYEAEREAAGVARVPRTTEQWRRRAQQICEAAARGESAVQIAASVGCNVQSVWRVLRAPEFQAERKAAGLERDFPLDATQRKALFIARRSGATLDELSTQFSADISTVIEALQSDRFAAERNT